MSLLSVEEALARVTAGLAPLAAERVALGDARGRVLAEALSANLTQPPFDASAMDGYAVRSEDIGSLPVSLRVIGEAAAGAGFAGKVQSGEAVRIFTGAPVPAGADTVVAQEDTACQDRAVTIKRAAAGAHVRPMGQDFQNGEPVLAAGIWMGPREMMLAAASNNADVAVRRKPLIGIIATGDELVPPGFDPAPDQIISSIPYGLSALALNQGAEVKLLGIAEDSADSLADLVAAGAGANILVTIGGASVGERDLVQKVLTRRGMKLDFSGIAMRPGKPLLFGRLKRQPVLGLPGNPVSAMICALVFLRPMIAKLLGREGTGTGLCRAVLGEALEANGMRQHYIRASSRPTAQGERLVTPLPSQDSSLTAAFARADCLIVRPPQAPAAAAGEAIFTLPLDI
jgi:molybdopterin molybdotransferase